MPEGALLREEARREVVEINEALRRKTERLPRPSDAGSTRRLGIPQVTDVRRESVFAWAAGVGTGALEEP